MSQAMASIEEVWGSSFSKRPQPLSSKSNVPEKRDAQAEGRVYNSPQERSAASIQTHRKTIDDLSNSLPIVKSDDEKNYPPAMSTNHGASLAPMTSSMKTINPIHEGFTPAYAPPGFQSEARLRQLMQKLDQDKSYGSDTNATHDMMLYIFTGIFFLFTLDSFVNMGRRMRR
jgi:hypothetical protein